MEARFSGGTLKPLEALALKEGEEVTITIVSSSLPSGTDWLEHTAGGWAGLVEHFNAVSYVTRRIKEPQPDGLGPSVISEAERLEGVYFSRDPKGSQATKSVNLPCS